MGRAPCCEKHKVKKGQWSPEEDALLKLYMETNGKATNWLALPKKIGLNRCGKSCRLRWLNYLRPNIRHGGFTEEEDDIISKLYSNIGTRWSIIAKELQGRTDNDIKNYWNTKLQKTFIEKKKSSRRHISCEGFLQTHEQNHIEYINLVELCNPNCNTFSITSGHIMPSNWGYSNSQLHSTKNGWPQFNMISFSATSEHRNKQQQQLQQQHGLMNLHQQPTIVNDVGSSSSSLMQQRGMNNNHNVRNVTLGTMLEALETALFTQDPSYEEMSAPYSLPCNHDENNMIENNTTNVANINGESIGSVDWGEMASLMSLPLDEFDHYINWEELSLYQEEISLPMIN